MQFWKKGCRAAAVAVAALAMGGLMAAPITAHADSGKGGKKDGKGGQIPIVIGPATIVKDPPSNPPKKKK